jgi:uncharacterized protein (DUF433 family)
MVSTPVALEVPLRTDVKGVIRVSGTRVTLHTLISAYRLGESPEALHEGFPTVPLADIYAVIAYYLANRDTVDAWMQRIDAEAARHRQEAEARDHPPTKEELLARLDAKKRGE